MARARASSAPPGFRVLPGALTEAQEQELAELLAALPFEGGRARRAAARPSVLHYRLRREKLGRALESSLEALRARAAELAGMPSETLCEAIVARYPPGARGRWHRDAPLFGPTAVAFCLLSPCELRLRRTLGGERLVHKAAIPARAAYVLGGEARRAWQHGIPAAPALLYSITFRSRAGRGGRGRRPRAGPRALERAGTAQAPSLPA